MLRIQASDPQLVDLGCVLDTQAKVLTAELDKIKETLRVEGLGALTHQDRTVVLMGNTNAASIVYPRATYKLNESRIEDLRRALGSRFHEFVSEKTSFTATPDFETLFSSLPAGRRTACTPHIEQKVPTPRVSFGKGAV